MRIGIDAHILGKKLGGVETVLFNLIRALAKIDLENQYFIYVDRRHTLASSKLPSNFVVSVLPFTNPWFQRPLLIPYVYWRDRLDLIHLQRARPFWGCERTVLHLHDIQHHTAAELFRGIGNSVKRRVLRYSAARATCILTVSQASRADIRQHYGVPAEKIHTVLNGLDHTVFHVLPRDSCLRLWQESTGLGDGDFILFVGAIERNKNLHRLLPAFADLRKRRPAFHDLRLMIIGNARSETTSGYPEELRRIAKELNVGDRVVFVGHKAVNVVCAAMNLARLVVFPSLAEGFGFPPLEAMACGTAVVASSIPALEEICGNAAVMVAPTDIESLTGAMQKVLEDTAFEKDLIARGLERAAQFTWEHAAAQVLEVYETCAKAPTGSSKNSERR